MESQQTTDRPLILVPVPPAGPQHSDPELTTLIDDLAIRSAQAIEKAGGQVVWFRSDGASDVASALDAVGGVLLLGGGDIDPATYGVGTRHQTLYNVDLATDLTDISIARMAGAAGLPLLAICRGMHVVNVAYGGTLIQHLEDTGIVHRSSDGEAMVDHDVTIDEASRVAGILGRAKVTVRSGHHQAVDRVGGGLRVVARTSDGIVEALEDDAGRVIAVQWHPEDHDADEADRAAQFGWLVAQAARAR